MNKTVAMEEEGPWWGLGVGVRGRRGRCPSSFGFLPAVPFPSVWPSADQSTCLPSSLGFFMRRYNQMAKGLGLSQAAHSQAAFSDDYGSDLGLNLPFLFCTVQPSQSCCKYEAQCPPSLFILVEVQLIYSVVLSSEGLSYKHVHTLFYVLFHYVYPGRLDLVSCAVYSRPLFIHSKCNRLHL